MVIKIHISTTRSRQLLIFQSMGSSYKSIHLYLSYFALKLFLANEFMQLKRKEKKITKREREKETIAWNAGQCNTILAKDQTVRLFLWFIVM